MFTTGVIKKKAGEMTQPEKQNVSTIKPYVILSLFHANGLDNEWKSLWEVRTRTLIDAIGYIDTTHSIYQISPITCFHREFEMKIEHFTKSCVLHTGRQHAMPLHWRTILVRIFSLLISWFSRKSFVFEYPFIKFSATWLSRYVSTVYNSFSFHTNGMVKIRTALNTF